MSLLVPEISDGRVDGFPVPHATFDVLDTAAIEAHIERADENGRFDARPRSTLDFLQRYHCVIEHHGAPTPTLAGILMFGRDPQYFFSHASVGLGHFPTVFADTSDVLHLKRHGGTLPQQIDAVESYLWSHTRRGFSVESGARRTERPEYPQKVIRELTVNAIAHRDYNATGKYTRISMFVDRIEWISPGGLPGGITLENILGEHHARNPNIAELLHQAGYIERFGIGLQLVLRELRRANLPDLRMRDTGELFTVVVQGHDAPTLQAQTPFRAKLLDYARRNGQITIVDARRLSEELHAFRSDRSLLNDLKGLVDAGLLRRVGRSRDTAYLPMPSDELLGARPEASESI